MTRALWVWLVGLLALFVGERLFGGGTPRLMASGLGLGCVLVAVYWRIRAVSSSHDARCQAARQALWWTLVASSALVLYALTTPTAVQALGFDESARLRWVSVWQVLMVVVLAVGSGPLVVVDALLAANPVAPPRGSVRKSVLSGLSGALIVTLAFPINYLANAHTVMWDVARARVTAPSEATLTVVRTLPTPVEVLLFFPPGNEVATAVQPYFSQLAQASNGLVVVRQVDQAVQVGLAQEHTISENGQIVLRTKNDAAPTESELAEGEPGDRWNTETVKLKTELNAAKSRLTRLDADVHKRLTRLTRGQSVAYAMTGHREASAKTRGVRKLSKAQQAIQNNGIRIHALGVAEGLEETIPEDADVVLVLGPVDPLSPAELASLVAYLDSGGSVLVAMQAGGAPLTELLAYLGLKPLPGVVADPEHHPPGANPFVVYTNRFGSHTVVSNAANYQYPVLVRQSAAFEKQRKHSAKHAVLFRSFESAFLDLPSSENTYNAVQEQGESAGTYALAYAVAGPPEAPYRAVVLGDVMMLTDPLLGVSSTLGNLTVYTDALSWLVRQDEAMGGVPKLAADVVVNHAPAGDWMGFVLALVLVPGGIALGGVSWVRSRKRRIAP